MCQANGMCLVHHICPAFLKATFTEMEEKYLMQFDVVIPVLKPRLLNQVGYYQLVVLLQ